MAAAPNQLSPLAESLKAAALCHSTHPAEAASALIAAAADVLCARFEPQVVGALIIETVGQALALCAPGGRA